MALPARAQPFARRREALLEHALHGIHERDGACIELDVDALTHCLARKLREPQCLRDQEQQARDQTAARPHLDIGPAKAARQIDRSEYLEALGRLIEARLAASASEPHKLYVSIGDLRANPLAGTYGSRTGCSLTPGDSSQARSSSPQGLASRAGPIRAVLVEM